MKLTKTKYIILGSNGNNGTLKRTLYRDERGELWAKYFNKWWNYNKGEIENYGIEDKDTGQKIFVSFDNLGKDLTKEIK